MATGKIIFLRPANTTAYSAGDVIGVADTVVPANAGSAVFPLKLGNPGQTVVISNASLGIALAAVPVGMAALSLEVYDGLPDTILDNAAYALSSSNDRSKHRGSIALAVPTVKGTSTIRTDNETTRITITLGDQGQAWFQLVTVAGFTPTSGEAYVLTVGAVAA